jgi:hypothetical protein
MQKREWNTQRDVGNFSDEFVGKQLGESSDVSSTQARVCGVSSQAAPQASSQASSTNSFHKLLLLQASPLTFSSTRFTSPPSTNDKIQKKSTRSTNKPVNHR